MSINYAKIGKRNRRLSLNSDLMQIHNSSKNNKTNSFSISLHQSQQAFNQKNISKVDLETPIEDPKSNFIGSKPKSEYTRKKFSFNDRNKMTNFLNIINDYIKQLDESSNCSTLPSDIQNKLENMLFLKFHIIQKRQEQLKIKYKQLQQDNAIENYENQTLKNKLFDLHNHFEELTRINYIQQLNLDKQKQKNKQLKLRYQYLSNSYLREKLKYENQKLKLKQNSISIQENNIYQDTNQSSQIMDYSSVRKFLKTQILKLKYNNRQIDNYSNLYKKYSDPNFENF